MATHDVLTPTLFADHPEHALHLQGGWWTVSCATCGCTVASARHQDQAERLVRRTPCTVCHPAAA